MNFREYWLRASCFGIHTSIGFRLLAFLYRRKDVNGSVSRNVLNVGVKNVDVSKEAAGPPLVINIINQFSFQLHQGTGLAFLYYRDSEAYLLCHRASHKN